MTIHVVQAGETVGSIAESYGVDPARLAADNAVPPSGAWRWDKLWWSAFPARSTLSGPGRPWLHRGGIRHHSPPPLAEQLASGPAEQPSSPDRSW